MRLTRRLLAALAGTVIAAGIAVALALLDLSTDSSVGAGDAVAKVAAGSIVVVPVLFAIYLGLASTKPLIKGHPYLNALALLTISVAVLGLVVGATSMVTIKSLSPATAVPAGILVGILWLLPGAALQVRVLHGALIHRPQAEGTEHA